MEATRITEKTRELGPPPSAFLPVRRSTPWLNGLWFAVGALLAMAARFFFDRERGSARRHMAYDKVVAAGRDAGRTAGKKATHWRNKATGTMTEIESSHRDTGAPGG